ncbi:MAG: hypothetical protein ACI9VR_005272 [Cognaticolwellia sp.]
MKGASIPQPGVWDRGTNDPQTDDSVVDSPTDTGTDTSTAPLECPDGSEANADESACVDIDECATQADDCESWELRENADPYWNCNAAPVSEGIYPLALVNGDKYGNISPGPEGSYFVNARTLGGTIRVNFDGSQTQIPTYSSGKGDWVHYEPGSDTLWRIDGYSLHQIDPATGAGLATVWPGDIVFMAAATAPESWGAMAGWIVLAANETSEFHGRVVAIDPANPTGSITTIARLDQQLSATAMAFDDTNTLYLVDSNRGLIKMDSDGLITDLDATLNQVDGLVIVGQTAWLANGYTGEIIERDLQTDVSKVVATLLLDGGTWATGITHDGHSNLVVLEAAANGETWPKITRVPLD